MRRRRTSKEPTRTEKIVRRGIPTAGRDPNLHSSNPKKRRLTSSTPTHSKIIRIITHSPNPKYPWAPNPTSSKANDRETNFSSPIVRVPMHKQLTIHRHRHLGPPPRCHEKRATSISEAGETKKR